MPTIDWGLFLSVLALVLVFEGMMPFLSPSAWRRFMRNMMDQSDRTIRIIGVVSMLFGVAILYGVHGL